jgi:hypothetical protein
MVNKFCDYTRLGLDKTQTQLTDFEQEAGGK